MRSIFGYLWAWSRPIPERSIVADVIGVLNYRRLRAIVYVLVEASGIDVPAGMGDDGLVAIYLYTHQDLETYHYKSINAVLRGEAHPKAPEILLFANALTNALRCLPESPGDLSRGTYLNADVLAEHSVGNVVTYKGFTSASRHLVAPVSGNVHYVIRGRTGRYIAPFSRFPAEEEVLFLPGTQFTVLQAELRSGKILIVLEEM